MTGVTVSRDSGHPVSNVLSAHMCIHELTQNAHIAGHQNGPIVLSENGRLFRCASASVAVLLRYPRR